MTYLQKLKNVGFNTPKQGTAANNFNNIYGKNRISKIPEIIIVGTFTPKEGRDNGFFYSSKKNKMFDYINNARNINLLKPKGKNAKVIANNISLLQQENIMFLDVVEYNYDSQNSSAKDDDINFNSLDYNAFVNYLNKDILFICNSHNAYQSFEKIIEEYKRRKNTNVVCRYVYVPQISWRQKGQEMMNQWLKVLKNPKKINIILKNNVNRIL